MIEREPSRTAMGAAAHRAVHQIIEQGRIFADPLAIPILGADPEILAAGAGEPAARGLRFFISARSAFAESRLSAAVEQSGVGQLVVLGAGLDTFGCRNPFGDRLKVFEIDHPASQAWKRSRLAAAGMNVPPSLVFAPMDFERDRLLDALAMAGFDPDRRSFFTWLGTIPYLTGEAIRTTFAAIGGLAGGAELVLDYSEPADARDGTGAAAHRGLAEQVAAAGEPFLSWFEPAAIQAELRAAGFTEIEDFTVRDLYQHHFGAEAVSARADAGAPVPDRGGHVLFAATAVRPA
jgi:methyltransferase (TIGR00027 family)